MAQATHRTDHQSRPEAGHVELAGVSKSYGATTVIEGLDLTVEAGEMAVLVGPSGCGKSTILRMIAGLEDLTTGSLRIGGVDCRALTPRQRGIAMVFQSYALYPHMTVAENMGFALKLSRVSKAEIEDKVRASARVLRMEHLLDRRPAELSGGQRQRAAIGRAIVRDPAVFLFDEPLSNLDAALRVEMRAEIARLHAELDATMIYVTHDQVEAMTLADKIVILDGGKVQQAGPPLELYNSPANRFVAEFLGAPKMNLIQVRHEPSRGLIANGMPGDVPLVPGRAPAPATADPHFWMGVRPHDLSLNDGGAITGTVMLVERLGNESHLSLKLADGAVWSAVVDGQHSAQVGATVAFDIHPERIHLFDGNGQGVLAP